jgi:hypothetical protein
MTAETRPLKQATKPWGKSERSTLTPTLSRQWREREL